MNDHNGTFIDWRITLWGECRDASTQGLLPMPTEDDDDDEEIISADVSTAIVSPGSVESAVLVNPTDHIDRPVNVKPTTTRRPTSVSPTSLASSSASVISLPSAKPNSADNLLPHYFPTFGVSKRTQIWIYGALAIIILFCAALGIYFYVQRRKRIRNSRDDYEFDILNDEDGNADMNGGANGKRVKKRAGELYDAFAGESDEELLTDEEEYRDERDDEASRGRSQSRADDEKQ